MAADAALRINGQALRVIIERSGYSLSRFAAECEISPGTLTDILKGRRNASPETAEAIRRELKIPLPAILIDPEQAA